MGSFAAVFNITTGAGLQDALNTTQSNFESDTINIAAGIYSIGGSTFTYTAQTGENSGLTIVGAGEGMPLINGGSSIQIN